MAKKPNILILYSDQHSARALGCYGNKDVITPNLDRLASEGVLMQNAYTQNPICTPSRMCMLTGQYVHNFGYYGLTGKMPHDLPNMFSHMQKQGYLTGAFGKIHCAPGWLSKNSSYMADAYNFEQPASQNLNVPGINGMMSPHSAYIAEEGQWQNNTNPFDGTNVRFPWDSTPAPLDKEYSAEYWAANSANKFLEYATERDQPFCVWMTVPKPHELYTPAKEFWDMYDEEKLTFPENTDNDMADRDENTRQWHEYMKEGPWVAFDPKEYKAGIRRVLHGYYANVTHVDAAMGLVLDKVKELGIEDDTIIVYMTDHGEFAGEHGMVEKAPGIGFRCVTRIPMIFKYKKMLPEHVERMSVMESIDVFPTLCEMAGLEMPNFVDGVSALPLLKDDTQIKPYAFTENPHSKTITDGRYKFTQFLPEYSEGKEFGLLYDMEKDPYEMHNLYFDPEYKEMVEKFRYELYCWLVRTTRVYTANPQIPRGYVKKSDDEFKPQWELAEHLGVYDDDGKVGETFYDYLYKSGNKNYM